MSVGWGFLGTKNLATKNPRSIFINPAQSHPQSHPTIPPTKGNTMSNQPRTNDRHKTPARAAKSKYALGSRRSDLGTKNRRSDHDNTAHFLVTEFPGQTTATYKAMHNAVDRFKADPTKFYQINYGVDPLPSTVEFWTNPDNLPTASDARILGIFDGLIDD